MPKEPQEALEAAFPASSDVSLARGIREGISLADHLRDSEPLLCTAIGSDLKGHIRRAGIIWRLQDLCY